MKKKILFICPSYFSYYSTIARSLTRIGYDINVFSYNTSNTIHLLFSKFGYESYFTKKYFKKISKTIFKFKPDILFVIKGECLSPSLWQKLLTQANFKSKFLYQWDSLRNFDYLPICKFFDKVYSFDRKDCAEHDKISYLPLFYDNETNLDDPISIDLLFVGIWHSDRIKVLTMIKHQAEEQKLKTYFKIYCPFWTWILLRLKQRHEVYSHLVTFCRISPKQMKRLYSKSKCVVDIAHPSQTGLTMRTIESIGANKKIITTNQNISKENFYIPDNIQIIDRNDPHIDFSFLDRYVDYPERDTLYIDNWTRSIIKDE